MKEELIRKYAFMIAKVGLNIKPGQIVLVEAAVEGYEFANMFAEEAYKLGAGEVVIHYLDLAKLKTEAKYRPADKVAEILEWQKESYQYYLDCGACTLRLEGVNPALMEDATEAEANAIVAFVDNMRNIMRAATRKKHCQWCIAMVPTQAWAEYIMPEEDKSIVLDKLWKVLLKLCYIDETNDIELEWEKKKARNREKASKIDELHLKELHYTSSNGTNLTVGLAKESTFGFPKDRKRPEGFVPFTPNIPSEEICTSPHKFRTEGIVYATKPLVLGGKKIENFGFRFENGKVVEVLAEEGREMLESLVRTDEGACYLGECALVEYHSPISMSGYVYYTTLIDENASCHLALGRALNSGSGIEYFNESQIHIDFMIGAADTEIVGITEDGRKVQIFHNGDFAI